MPNIHKSLDKIEHRQNLKNSLFLAGDIGGTKTSLALFSIDSGAHTPLAEATYRSLDYPDLNAVIGDFLSKANARVVFASFGVAGPVVDEKATITNLPWSIEAQNIKNSFSFERVFLLNDLVAIGTAIPTLRPDDLMTLIPGKPKPGGTISVIAPGTGLGEAYLTWDGQRYHPFASEGGHSDFAPKNNLEINLLRYLQERFNHVSCERVCSGSGIPNIYNFLKDSGYAEEPEWLSGLLDRSDDPTPIIIKAALDQLNPCGLCKQTLYTFVSILGAEAGNLALKVLSTGGVYLGGGIPPHIVPYLTSDSFEQAFRHKGRLTKVLEHIPVYVILNRKSALIGAAYYGMQIFAG